MFCAGLFANKMIYRFMNKYDVYTICIMNNEQTNENSLRLNTTMWFENTFNCLLTVKSREIFYQATLTPSFINFKYSLVLEFLNAWG